MGSWKTLENTMKHDIMRLRETLFHSDLALEDWQLMACLQLSIITGSPAGLVLCKALETTMPPLEKSEASSRCDQFAQASRFFGRSEQDVTRQCSWSKTALPAGILLFSWKVTDWCDSERASPILTLQSFGHCRSSPALGVLARTSKRQIFLNKHGHPKSDQSQ